jgi:crotonobetainyl-CoA:carnitine CoA-transferase CaiB-like acyl-CoA transferase
MQVNPHGPLSDIRVLDLTQMLAGPFCTQLLADFGADVIKVEPIRGDSVRAYGPFHPDDSIREYGGYFQSVNRNKRGVAIDLKSPLGRDVLLKMAENADVLVENFRAGTLEGWGLSYERLQERNPRLVYASIRGFGDPRTAKNDYIDWPAYDLVSQAMGGMIGITGPDPKTPVKVGPGVGDIIPGLYAAFSVMAAVHHARRSGQGQYVDVAMVDSVLAVCERIIYQKSVTGIAPAAQGNRHPLFAPYSILKSKDGWVVIACPNEKFWKLLCSLMSRDELASDPRFATQELRIQNVLELEDEIEAFTSKRTKKELSSVLGGRIPFAPVYDMDDIQADSYFRERGMLVDLQHPGTDRVTTVAGIPVKMTKTPGAVLRRAPMLGEHTDEVLQAAGYSVEDIEKLRASGATR